MTNGQARVLNFELNFLSYYNIYGCLLYELVTSALYRIASFYRTASKNKTLLMSCISE